MAWRFHVWVFIGIVALPVTDSHAFTVRFTPAASSRLSIEARTVIERIAVETKVEVTRHLPELPPDIALLVDVGSNVIDQTGEVGMAINAQTIRWTLNPDRPEGATAIAIKYLRWTLFHESHHVVRGWLISSRIPSTTFMDAVVAEGLATAFARDAASAVVPWGEYPDDILKWANELLALPNTRETWSRYNQWMFAHPDGRQWIGYKAGTFIADAAIKASGKSAAQLTTTSTAEVLRFAGL